MSSRNAQTLRDLYDAWNRGDVEGVIEHVHPELEFRLSGIYPDLAAEYHGHEGFRELWRQLVGTWEELIIDVEGFEELGERVLVVFRFRARGRDGIAVERPFAHLVTMRAGRVLRVRGYADLEEARRALAVAAPQA